MRLEERLIREIPHLRRFARSLTRDAADADDLVQSVLERALGRLQLLRKPSSLRSWLFRITYNLHINERIRQRRVPIPMDPSDPALDLAVAPDQLVGLEAQGVVDALYLLPEDQRAAIILTAIEELSYKEAASVLDIPIGTLMSRLYRGRLRLRELTDGVDRGPTVLRRVK